MVSGKVEKQDCTELDGRSGSPGQNDRKIPVCNGAKTRKPLKPGSDGVVRLSGGNLQIAKKRMRCARAGLVTNPSPAPRVAQSLARKVQSSTRKRW
jgi:hypothetical protein